jgi:hypothetical protein
MGLAMGWNKIDLFCFSFLIRGKSFMNCFFLTFDLSCPLCCEREAGLQ